MAPAKSCLPESLPSSINSLKNKQENMPGLLKFTGVQYDDPSYEIK